jgi:hypothetical protein
MSMIVHRCECGHPDIFHADARDPQSSCSYGGCDAPRTGHEYGPSELIPSWSSDIKGTSVLVEEITTPGTRVHQYPKLCDCDDCLSLYKQLAATP